MVLQSDQALIPQAAVTQPDTDANLQSLHQILQAIAHATGTTPPRQDANPTILLPALSPIGAYTSCQVPSDDSRQEAHLLANKWLSTKELKELEAEG
jgi:hypothetical protein